MKEKIISANGTVLGGIINRTDYKKLDYPYYRYYHKYAKYYHKSKPAEMHEVNSANPRDL